MNKSSGVTETERALSELCERTFLKLWSYTNPFKDDGHEMCDLIAVFDNHVFIFFDRENILPEDDDKDPKVLWNRWKNRVIDRQIKTAHGAERYIRSGRPIFLDGKRDEPFPIAIDPQKTIVHKIIVAHGAKDACERASEKNVYGSLAITYGVKEEDSDQNPPFHISIDKENPVHILDSHNFSIILSELDTVSDFSSYLDEKLRAISRFDFLSYCGEEDLLGHYLLNYDKESKRHIIGASDEEVNGVIIGEGEWHDFIQTDLYINTKSEDRISYLWDELIQRTCQNELDGTTGGNSDIFRGNSAIIEMAKESRFIRRVLASQMVRAINNFPDSGDRITRHLAFMPSFRQEVGYVFFQLRIPANQRNQPDYREKRLRMLEIACGVTKNKFQNLKKVVGIGMDAPKFSGEKNSEDFILLPCENWSDEIFNYYQNENKVFRFFETSQLKEYREHVTQFVPPSAKSSQPPIKPTYKVGRNEQCPCGSGKKYKKCHGA